MCIRTTLMVWIVFFSACCAAWADVPRGVDLASLESWDIVVAEGAIASESYAAEQFQHFVAKATGHTLPIVKQTQRPDRHVFIGPGKPMRESKLGFSTDGFGPEDLRIVIRDEAIVIAGGRPRGTLYGVYVFLEDYFGARFLTAEHTHVPPVGTWRVVGPVDRFYHPPLEMRWAYYGEFNFLVTDIGNLAEPRIVARHDPGRHSYATDIAFHRGLVYLTSLPYLSILRGPVSGQAPVGRVTVAGAATR